MGNYVLRTTEAERLNFNGSTKPLLKSGQLLFTTDTLQLWCGDGATTGGKPVALKTTHFRFVAAALPYYGRFMAILGTDNTYDQVTLDYSIRILGIGWNFDLTPDSGKVLQVRRGSSSIGSSVSITAGAIQRNLGLDISVSGPGSFSVRMEGGTNQPSGFIAVYHTY